MNELLFLEYLELTAQKFDRISAELSAMIERLKSSESVGNESDLCPAVDSALR